MISRRRPRRDLEIVNINGLTVENFSSNETQYAAINIIDSSNIQVNQPHIRVLSTAGITIQESDAVAVGGMWVEQSSGDGIDVTASTNVNIHDGLRVADILTNIHPDCVQLWSLISPIASSSQGMSARPCRERMLRLA